MPRLPPISNDRPQRNTPGWPLWYRLDESSQYALQLALRKNHRRTLIPPDPPWKRHQIESLDEIERIIAQPPECSEHLKET
jgi:hypothetical protein